MAKQDTYHNSKFRAEDVKLLDDLVKKEKDLTDAAYRLSNADATEDEDNFRIAFRDFERLKDIYNKERNFIKSKWNNPDETSTIAYQKPDTFPHYMTS